MRSLCELLQCLCRSIGLAWYFIRMGQVGGALMVLVGFDCFLRTGEFMSLIISDFKFGEDGRGVVKLGHTKNGETPRSF